MAVLCSAQRAIGRFAFDDASAKTYVNEGGISLIKKCLTSSHCTDELRSPCMSSIGSLAVSDYGVKMALADKELMSLLYTAVKDSKTQDTMVTSAQFVQSLARTPAGFAALLKNGMVEEMCRMIDENIENSAVVGAASDALAKLAENAEKMSQNQQRLLVDSMLKVLEKRPDDSEMCLKALKILADAALKSDYVKQRLRGFDGQKILKGFENTCGDEKCLLAWHDLKDILAGATRKITMAEASRQMDESASKLALGEENADELNQTYYLSEAMVGLIQENEEMNVKELLDNDGVKRVAQWLKKLNECAPSELQAKDLENTLLLAATLMAHDRQSVLAAVRSGCVQSALTACERYPDNEEIFKQTKRMVDILEATKMEILNELKEELDSPSPDANKCVRQLDLLKELHEPSKNLPPSFDSGQ
eukprot:830945_1